MIVVTDRAKQELKKLLYNKVENWYAGLRLTVNDQGKMGLGIDVEMPGDRVVEYGGSKVLLVEQGLDSSLKDITLDVEDTGEGSELLICETA
ncbi:hypothetical protein ACFLXU_05555 [Chloroflexota bacterium]